MYLMYYDGKILHDPISDSIVTSAIWTGGDNACDYLDFTISADHPLRDTIKQRKGIVELYDDDDLLFRGQVYDVTEDIYGNKEISCNGALSFLFDTVVRPYSTILSDAFAPSTIAAPPSPAGLFQWYITQHNLHMVSQEKKFSVDINMADKLDSNAYIYRSSTWLPTTLDEITDKLLNTIGGHLFVRYENGINILDYYSDIHEINSQIIDFGVNMLDFSKKTSASKCYTAIRPSGGDEDTDVGGVRESITIKSIIDGYVNGAGDMYKINDVVYCPAAVEKYGYNELAWSNTDCMSPQTLLKSAISQLRTLLEPSNTIEVSAVDMALLSKEYKHLRAGQAVRCRCLPRNFDRYMIVSEVSLDLIDPKNTKYVIGEAYDTLTGKESVAISKANGLINENVDSVASLSVDVISAAIAAEEATEAAEDAVVLANQKRRVFYEQPYPPYEVGDLWVQGENGDILVCTVGRSE